jgi:hypothetical protein
MYGTFTVVTFEWDSDKDRTNQSKHGVSFEEAQLAFADPKRVIAIDHTHSDDREERFFCFGKTNRGVLTVRFTLRGENIRIFGAGLWREGKQVYEKQNKVS